MSSPMNIQLLSSFSLLGDSSLVIGGGGGGNGSVVGVSFSEGLWRGCLGGYPCNVKTLTPEGSMLD